MLFTLLCSALLLFLYKIKEEWKAVEHSPVKKVYSLGYNY